jgi:TRAP transporter TAXI family solute receptor
MKKYYLISAIAIIICLFIAGCTPAATTPPTKSGTPPVSTPPAEKATFPKVIFISPPAGTQPHTVAVAWTTLANKYVPGLQISIEPAVGAPQAVIAFLQGKADMCYVSSNILTTELSKYIGGKTLAAGPQHLVAAIGGAVHIVARADSGITSVADFKGKKILGKVATGGGVDLARQKILAAYGLTDNDITLLSGNNGSHLASQLKEGVGDAALIFLGLNDASLIDLCTSKDITWITMPKDKMVPVAEEAWFVIGTIPANTYPKQDKEILAFRTPSSFDVQPTMPENEAYELTKLYFDHNDEFIKMAPWSKDYNLKETLTSGYLPFHPGAIKYYKEKGIWNDAAEARQKELLAKKI